MGRKAVALEPRMPSEQNFESAVRTVLLICLTLVSELQYSGRESFHPSTLSRWSSAETLKNPWVDRRAAESRGEHKTSAGEMNTLPRGHVKSIAPSVTV